MRICFTILLLLISPFIFADRLIIEPDMGRKPIIDMINQSKQSIDLVMYGLTDDTLLKALIAQQKKGRSLKIILEKTPYRAENENNKAIIELDKNHIQWHATQPHFRLTHQKTLISDDKQAMIMTFNFTRSTFKNDRNFALVIDDAKKVNAIKQIFSADWNHQSINNSDQDLILSPDDSRVKLLALINRAKSSIKIYAQSANDFKIVGALAKAARNGVQVELLTSAKIRDKQAMFMQRAGILIKQSKSLYIHAKVFIIDNKLAVIGSTNLTRASLDDNRELSVVTRDQDVIKQLNNKFDKDWKAQPSPIRSSAITNAEFRFATQVLRKFLAQAFH